MARHRRINRQLSECRERKYRLRGRSNSSKFIPAGDSDFARMARHFANHVAEHAERFAIAPEQAARLVAAVESYRSALSRAIARETAGPKATWEKNSARAEAEKIVRAVARSLRGLDEGVLTNVDRFNLNLHERPRRLKSRSCPQIAPVLRFIGGTHGAAGTAPGGARHILEYGNDFDHASNAKPHGASRLELFVELVPPPQMTADMPRHIASYDPTIGGQIPTHPAQLSGGRLWYLRSYTTSRFEVEFPVLSDGTPMLVVYWGRWADARGNVGPFSKTCVARVEGAPGSLGMPELMYSHGARPALGRASLGPGVSRRIQANCVVVETPIAGALPDGLEGDAQRDDEAMRQIAEQFGQRISGLSQRMLEAAGTGGTGIARVHE